MGLGELWKGLQAGSSLNAFYKNIRNQKQSMWDEDQQSEGAGLSSDRFMSGIKAVSESQDTYKVFKVYAEDENPADDPGTAVVNEFNVFLRDVNHLVSDDTVLEYAEHMMTNEPMKTLAQKYPNDIMTKLHAMATYHCPDEQGMLLLATLEKQGNENFFPYITSQAEGSHVADFFIQARKGIADGAAVARFRGSPSFQAAQENPVFLDHLTKNDPILLEAVNQNYNHTAEQNL